MKLVSFLFLMVTVLFLSSCASNPVDNAFAGKLDSEEQQSVIVEYCQSCHTHRDFNPNIHISAVTELYTEREFRYTEKCVTCHSIKRDFWRDIVRYTYFPEGRIVAQ